MDMGTNSECQECFNRTEPGEDCVETSNEKVIFSHSGNPFTLDDIFSIVNQTSSKNRMDMDQNIDEVDDAIPETTGKFGTGFITTHLLSRVIYLKSIYQSYDTATQSNNYRHFQLTLDRSARTLKQFVDYTIGSLVPILQSCIFQSQFSISLMIRDKMFQ